MVADALKVREKIEEDDARQNVALAVFQPCYMSFRRSQDVFGDGTLAVDHLLDRLFVSLVQRLVDRLELAVQPVKQTVDLSGSPRGQGVVLIVAP